MRHRLGSADDHASWLVPTFGVTTIGMMIWLDVESQRDRWTRPRGRRHTREHSALAAHLDAWPTTATDGVVRWHDLATSTKRDIHELLYERGWYYRAQDIDGEGWPLHVTRDPRLAVSTERPPSRLALLEPGFRAATSAGATELVIDLATYRSMPRGEVGRVGSRLGWQVGAVAWLRSEMGIRATRLGLPSGR